MTVQWEEEAVEGVEEEVRGSSCLETWYSEVA
jgi:hypothetical protein